MREQGAQGADREDEEGRTRQHEDELHDSERDLTLPRAPEGAVEQVADDAPRHSEEVLQEVGRDARVLLTASPRTREGGPSAISRRGGCSSGVAKVLDGLYGAERRAEYRAEAQTRPAYAPGLRVLARAGLSS